MTVPKSNPGKENWETFVTDKTEIFLDDMDVFQNYCVVYERQRTVPQLRIVPFDKPEDQYIVQLPKDICVLEAASNLMYDHRRVRLSVSSPILPACVLEYNMETKSMVEKHSFSDLPSIDSSDFCCTRHEIQRWNSYSGHLISS